MVVLLCVGVIGFVAPKPALAATKTDAVVEPATGPVVVLTVDGVRWSDIDEEHTPYLYGLTGASYGAQLSVRSVYRVTCAVDGWLTLGAGRRAAMERIPGMDEGESRPELNSVCPQAPDVQAGEVDGWKEIVAYNQELDYNAKLGQLAEALDAGNVCATAVGRGAALVLADSTGRVKRFEPSLAALGPETVNTCPLTVVELAGVDLRSTPASLLAPRSDQLHELDEELGAVLESIPESATVLVVGLGNPSARAELQVAALRQADGSLGFMTSSSTRAQGLVLMTDLMPTLLQLLDLPTASDSIGAPFQTRPTDFTIEERNVKLVELERRVDGYSDVAPPFFIALVGLQLILYGLAAWVIRSQPRTSAGRRRALRAVGFSALLFTAMPVATFLANIVPWWTWDRPRLALVVLCSLAALSIALLAQVGRRLHGILGEVTLVSTATAVVLAIDVIGEDVLQTASLMGYSPVIAGRLYGFGNVAFALFVTTSIFASAFAADWLVRRGNRRGAALLVAVAGVACLLVDGLPSLGSDFGGVLAIAPAFGVLLLGVLELSITWRRVLALVGLGAAVVMSVAILDWLRPSGQQTHLGRFVQQVLDGELTDIVVRKLDNNLNILGSSFLGVLVPSALVFGLLVLLRAGSGKVAVLRDAFDRAPLLKPALTAWLVAMLIGVAVNDSALAIPAVGILFAIPALIVISTRVLELQQQQQRQQLRERSDDENSVTPTQ